MELRADGIGRDAERHGAACQTADIDRLALLRQDLPAVSKCAEVRCGQGGNRQKLLSAAAGFPQKAVAERAACHGAACEHEVLLPQRRDLLTRY